MDPDGRRLISAVDQRKLLSFLGIEDPVVWERCWRQIGAATTALNLWHPDTSCDWLWSLGLPILSLADHCLDRKRLIGLSALPGCGKSSFGVWIEAAARNLGRSVQVVSIDDFYFPAPELDQTMQGNPWGVPRALPGSHDLALLESTLSAWKSGAEIRLPRFDKGLRGGRGDRLGWRSCSADLLVLEGWFLGCRSGADPTVPEEHLEPPLLSEEVDYRWKVQDRLSKYGPIWDQLDQLWHLRAEDLRSPVIWKQQQEDAMRRSRGVGLDDESLDNFIRMILSAIPSSSLRQINADVVIDVDPDRQLKRIHVRRDLQSSLSSDSLTG